MKKIVGICAAAALLLVGIIAASPYLALYQMKVAIHEKDAESLSEHVDFPALRENIKGQLMENMGTAMDTPEMRSNPFAGMGKAFGLTMVNTVVDKLVSPAGVVALMQGAAAHAEGKTPTDYDHTSDKAPNYSLAYKGLNRVHVRIGGSRGEAGTFTLHRDGLWNWKLTNIDVRDSASS